ncbi:MAG: AcrR family transcriptional regulator [Myxococcota bacterium]|jgi:AcrR family transcriptional regulator
MGRPRNADSTATRQKILDAAIRRFGDQGFQGASQRTIAADVGITFATVHHYFGAKAQLYEACVAAAFADFEGLQSELFAEVAQRQGTAPKELVRFVVGRAFRFALRRPVSSRFLLRANVYETEAPARARLEQARTQYLDGASRALSPLLDRPEAALRIPLQGLMYLLTRLAVARQDELDVLANGTPDVQLQLESYVSDVAVATLLRPSLDDRDAHAQ